MQKKVEAAYSSYANDKDLIAAGTVRACSQGVYRAALSTLRCGLAIIARHVIDTLCEHSCIESGGVL